MRWLDSRRGWHNGIGGTTGSPAPSAARAGGNAGTAGTGAAGRGGTTGTAGTTGAAGRGGTTGPAANPGTAGTTGTGGTGSGMMGHATSIKPATHPAGRRTARPARSTRAYGGPLYQVAARLGQDHQGHPVGAGGFANSSMQDSFCSGTTCTIPIIYDQSATGITFASPGSRTGCRAAATPPMPTAAKTRSGGTLSTASRAATTSRIERACSCPGRRTSPRAGDHHLLDRADTPCEHGALVWPRTPRIACRILAEQLQLQHVLHLGGDR